MSLRLISRIFFNSVKTLDTRVENEFFSSFYVKHFFSFLGSYSFFFVFNLAYLLCKALRLFSPALVFVKGEKHSQIELKQSSNI